MTERIALGLIGAGGIAQSYAQALQPSACARIAAVADLRPEAARALAEDVGAVAFDSFETLAAKADCDGVLVCTPPASHPEIVLHFLERGVPVLCEKPLAIGVEDARSLLRSAEGAGVALTMASKFRYVDDVIRARSILASGVLGEIVLIENSFTARVDMSRRWNSNRAVAGGGVLIDNGTHSVDIVRYLCGPIVQVEAIEGMRIQGLPVEDTARLFVRTEGGTMGSIDLSWSVNKDLASYIDVYGSAGTMRVGWRESRYRHSSGSDWVVFGAGYDKLVALRRQVENFCRSLRGEETLLITADDALASVEVIEAAYRSLEQDGWVSVGSAEASPAAPA